MKSTNFILLLLAIVASTCYSASIFHLNRYGEPSLVKRADNWHIDNFNHQVGFSSYSNDHNASSSQDHEQGGYHSGVASDYIRDWNGSEYKLHEYQYARSELENRLTGEILPSEWDALLEMKEKDAVMTQSEFRQRALDPLREIRERYMAAGRGPRSVTDEECEYDYCVAFCLRDLNPYTYKQSQAADVIEARVMYDDVKRQPWGKEK